jgi:hypothetical protein
LAVLKLAVLVSGVLALAKLGFLDFITGGFGGLQVYIEKIMNIKRSCEGQILSTNLIHRAKINNNNRN